MQLKRQTIHKTAAERTRKPEKAEQTNSRRRREHEQGEPNLHQMEEKNREQEEQREGERIMVSRAPLEGQTEGKGRNKNKWSRERERESRDSVTGLGSSRFPHSRFGCVADCRPRLLLDNQCMGVSWNKSRVSWSSWLPFQSQHGFASPCERQRGHHYPH